MDTGERRMNPVAMTIINLRKQYWPSPGIKSATSCSQVLCLTDLVMGLDMKAFDDHEEKPFENIERKGENACNQYFLLFPQCSLPYQREIALFESLWIVTVFSTRFLLLSSNLKLSSASSFSLGEPKICRFGKGYLK